MLPYTWLVEAHQRIAPYTWRTPLTYDPELELYFKWENRQRTGSFKARGAFNKLLSLEKWERERGVVSASAGNHGQGVALAGQLSGTRVLVFAAESAVPAKLEAMRKLGAELHLVPGGFSQAEQAGLEYAAEQQMTWVSPYNDGAVIAGQGTLAMEAYEERPDLAKATWVVPTSGGGLLAGIGAFLKAPETAMREVRLVGVQSDTSPFMHGLYYTGSQAGLVELPTLADGLAGPVEPGSITIALVRKTADAICLVTEEAIAAAIRFAWERYQEKIEGSAAAALAAVLGGQVSARPAVVVISGGNIQPEVHEKIVGGHEEMIKG